MKTFLCPSMMCADLDHIEDEIAAIDRHVDLYHCDIMDGKLVPRHALSIEQIKKIRSLTKKPLDTHLMAVNPIRYVNELADIGVDIMYFQLESFNKFKQIEKCCDKVKSLGKKFGIVISSGKSIDDDIRQLENELDVDNWLVMGGVIGFTGHSFDDNTFKKLIDLRTLVKDSTITIDGGVTIDLIKTLRGTVDGFVMGTNVLFRKVNRDYNADFRALDAIIGDYE